MEERHENEHKNGWWGIDPLKVEYCFQCNRTVSINYMDNAKQGWCIGCVKELKRIRKGG